MVSITHADVDTLADDEVRIPAGGRMMELDWNAVAEAFEGANEELGWEAAFVISPEKRHVCIRIPVERVEHVAGTTLDFYSAVARRVGREEFMSVWIDFDVESDPDVQPV
jgi:hypothetical protein